MYMEEYVFVKKHVYKWAKNGLANMRLSQKDSPWSNNTLSGKEKVLGAVVNKEEHADSLLMSIDFLENSATVNSSFYCQLVWQNLPYL